MLVKEDWMVGWLVGCCFFCSISTLVGYLKPSLVYTYIEYMLSKKMFVHNILKLVKIH